MARKSNVHIVHNKGDLRFPWDIRYNKETVSSFATKKMAIEEGRELAKMHKTELVIHGKNGKIQRKHSYGNDPRNIKG